MEMHGASALALSAAAAACSLTALLVLYRHRVSRASTAPLVGVLAGLQMGLVILPYAQGAAQFDPVHAAVVGPTLATLLLVHVRETAQHARMVMLAMMGAALVSGGVLALALAPTAADPLALARDVAYSAVLRALLLFLGTLVTLQTYEVVAHVAPKPTALRVVAALVLALSVDAALDALAHYAVAPDVVEQVLGSLGTAAVGAVVCGVGLSAWLTRVEDPAYMVVAPDRPVLDLLSVLTGQDSHLPVREETVRDSISGVYSRSFFTDVAPAELQRAREMGRPAGVLTIQLDPNRTAAPAQDAVGRALMGSLRMTDIPSRTATGRFVVVLPGANLSAAHDTATRIHRALAEDPLVEVVDTDAITIGVACFPEDGDTPRQLIRRAEDRRVRRSRAQDNDVL